jgi:hypothetical protein
MLDQRPQMRFGWSLEYVSKEIDVNNGPYK